MFVLNSSLVFSQMNIIGGRLYINIFIYFFKDIQVQITNSVLNPSVFAKKKKDFLIPVDIPKKHYWNCSYRHIFFFKTTKCLFGLREKKTHEQKLRWHLSAPYISRGLCHLASFLISWCSVYCHAQWEVSWNKSDTRESRLDPFVEKYNTGAI